LLIEQPGGKAHFYSSLSSSFSSSCICTGFLVLIRIPRSQQEGAIIDAPRNFLMMMMKPVQVQDDEKDKDEEKE
jgi:hypothetical protein